MFKKFDMIENIKKIENINKQFSTNPITSNNFEVGFDNINQKIDSLINCIDLNIKQKGISEIVDGINSLSEQEIILLLSSNNELIRSFAAKAYVNKNPENLIHKLKKMLKNENDYTRDSAVAALCHINSVNILNLLHKATNDKNSLIKIKALAGIADIALEYSNKEAKEILQQFLSDENPEIREFVSDELSILT